MLDVTFAGWAATIGLIVVLFAIDLFVSRPGHAHTVGFREAAIASVFHVSVALAFGVVFVVIMTTFAVPAEHQQRVLTFGILVALVMRAIFIALGAVLIASFSFMFLIRR